MTKTSLDMAKTGIAFCMPFNIFEVACGSISSVKVRLLLLFAIKSLSLRTLTKLKFIYETRFWFFIDFFYTIDKSQISILKVNYFLVLSF